MLDLELKLGMIFLLSQPSAGFYFCSTEYRSSNASLDIRNIHMICQRWTLLNLKTDI